MTIDQALMQAGLPRLEARMLLEYVTGYPRVTLIAHPEYELCAEQAQRFSALCSQRQAGTPMAYLLGEREFFGRVFRVTPDVLIPRPETELLVESVLARLQPQQRVLDLGTGSGAIAVSVALERPDVAVTMVDVSAAALAVAQENAERLGATCQAVLSDWYTALADTRFDLIVSNPPYIADQDPHLSQGDLRFEPQSALTDFGSGLSAIETIVQGAPTYLQPQGWLLIEHGYDQGAACRECFLSQGWNAVETLRDWNGQERITLGRLAELRAT